MPFIPHTADDVARMLEVIGAPSIEALFDEIPAALKAQPLDGVPPGALRNGCRAPRHRTRRGRRPLAQLHRRGRLRAPYPRTGLGHRYPRRVLFRIYALSGGGEPGDLAADLRVPVDDLRSHRHGSRQRLAVRRCVLARRGLPDGRALEPRLDLAPHPHAAHRQPDLPQGRAVDHTAIRASSSRLWTTSVHRGACRSMRSRLAPARITPRWWCSSRTSSATWRRSTRSPTGRTPTMCCVIAVVNPISLALLKASGRVGFGQGRPLGRRHRVRRRTAARRAARLGRSVLRLHGDAPAIRATDAGTHRRTHLGRGRAARLHPDPAGARAAHPPQQGHLQHLHQSGADGDRGDDLHVAPRRRGSRGRRDRERAAHRRAGAMRSCGSTAWRRRSRRPRFHEAVLRPRSTRRPGARGARGERGIAGGLDLDGAATPSSGPRCWCAPPKPSPTRTSRRTSARSARRSRCRGTFEAPACAAVPRAARLRPA